MSKSLELVLDEATSPLTFCILKSICMTLLSFFIATVSFSPIVDGLDLSQSQDFHQKLEFLDTLG
jgi:hypothetical protein